MTEIELNKVKKFVRKVRRRLASSQELAHTERIWFSPGYEHLVYDLAPLWGLSYMGKEKLTEKQKSALLVCALYDEQKQLEFQEKRKKQIENRGALWKLIGKRS